MKTLQLLVCTALLFVSSMASAVQVPVKEFFKEAEFESVRLAPDGKHLAIVVPREDRSLLVVLDLATKKAVGSFNYGENRFFNGVMWANDHRLLFRVAIRTGSLDFDVAKGDLYAADLDGTHAIDIPNGATYGVVGRMRDDQDNILVERSIDGGAFLYKLNVNNGRIATVSSAPVDYGHFVLDSEYRPRYVIGEMKDGSTKTFRRDADKWTFVHSTKENALSSLSPIAMDADDQHVLVLASDHGEPESVRRLDPETGNTTLVSSNPRVDPSSFLFSSDDRTLLGVLYEDGVPEWDFVDSDNPESAIYKGLVKAFPDKQVSFGGATQDGKMLAFYVSDDRSPGEAYLFSSKTGQATYLLSAASWIKPEDMSPMKPVQFKARDGAMLYGYVTVPAGSSGRNLPLIVHPHGGPHGIRDDWSWQPEVQLLANRGYVVLQLNYRGSGGYGKAYEQAGYRKWGTLMQDDLTDGVRYLASQGIIDANRVCIYGGSYGGYASLMSPEREPDLYKCAVGYAGVYDLDIQRTKSDTSRSEYGMSYLNKVYPDNTAERQAQSPAYNVDRLKAAVGLVHGRKDQRVPIQHMDFLISQMKKAGKAPEFVLIEDKEAHGFQKPEHNVELYDTLLPFFDKYIGPDSAAAKAGAGH